MGNAQESELPDCGYPVSYTGGYAARMDMNEATAKAIQAERAISGKTVRELAEDAQIPLSSLMRVLGAEREIKVNQIARIAYALGIEPHEIVESAERILGRDEPHRRAGGLRLAGSEPPPTAPLPDGPPRPGARR